MKRILTATALVSMMATGALANDASTINQYIPEVDVSTLSDQQVAALVGIAGSADEADKEQKMRAYLGVYSSPETVTTTRTVTPAEAEAMQAAETDMSDPAYYDNTIASFLPDVDPATLSDEQKAALISIATGSGNENDKEREMRAYLGAS